LEAEAKQFGLGAVTAILFGLMMVTSLFGIPGPTGSSDRIIAESSGGSDTPSPQAWIGNEFVISYDETGQYDADTPDVAIAPPGTPWAGSMHAVWAEMNNSNDFHFSEIHYSKSEAWEAGRDWSNDEPSEGDRLISQDFTPSNGANPGNATRPSVAIDQMGWLHVVWVEQYPDWTYEIHYSRSQDNGNTWTGYDQQAAYGDIVVSGRSGQNGLWINQPRIAVTSSPLTLHVVWDEVSPTGETSNIWYSRSGNQGNTWSEAYQVNLPAAQGPSPPSNPDIATSGPGGGTVHIIWTQEFEQMQGVFAEDIYHSRSMNNGLNWEPASAISLKTPHTSVGRPRMSSCGDGLCVVWPQRDYSVQGSNDELFLSASSDNGGSWSGMSQDIQVSFGDGHEAMDPAISFYDGPGGTEAHVVWVEFDESSPLATDEVHHSMSPDPMDPISWTGQTEDVVISVPDTAEAADAAAPTAAVGVVGGELRPQVFWQEVNVASSTGRAERNNEIHYLPDQTFDIPVHSGWNLISVPLILDNNSITAALDDSQGDGLTAWDVVKWYDPMDASDPWKTYRANGTANDLWNADNTMGLWVHVTAVGDGFLTAFGDYGNSTQINLRAGWNLVGYPAQASRNVTASLGSLNDRPVECYDSNSTGMISQMAGSEMMAPGAGYWVHVAADALWTVDW
jgi:hypothetical protein